MSLHALPSPIPDALPVRVSRAAVLARLDLVLSNPLSSELGLGENTEGSKGGSLFIDDRSPLSPVGNITAIGPKNMN
jgi:hypothetical protein